MREKQEGYSPARDDSVVRQADEISGSESTGRLSGPHFRARSQQVLARVPDLESADSASIEETLSTRGDGRILSSGLSMKILYGAGAVLLVAALALPFLLSDSESSTPISTDESAAWQREGPAVTAPMAPAWNAGTGESPNWQAEPIAGEGRWGEAPAVSAWQGGSGSGQRSSPPQSQPGLGPPRVQPWQGRSQSQTWETQRDTPNWGAPIDAPRGREFAADNDWTRKANPAGATVQAPAMSWNDGAQTPSWETAPQGFAGQAPEQAPPEAPQPYYGGIGRQQFAGAAGPDPASPLAATSVAPRYENAYQPSRPAPAGSGSYQPYVDANPSMAIRPGDAPSSVSGYGTRYLGAEQPSYRAADARAVPDAGQAGCCPNGQGRPSPSGYLPNGYPSTRYPSAGRPAVGAEGPDSPATDYPSGAYRTGVYPPANYPTTDHPSAGYPSADYPSGNYPSSGYPPDGYGPAAAPPRRGDRTGAYAPYAEPGVARFQGGIGKPTGSNLDERDRPRLY